MRRTVFRITAILGIVIFLASCGGGPLSFLGPIFDINEIKHLALDQFYTTDGLDDEYADTGDFAIYIRDAVTGQDIACVGASTGMEDVRYLNTYYGGLSVRFREVEGEHPESVARVQLLFVEQDSPGCPAPIANADDIIGITPEIAAEELIDNNVWTANGVATAVLRVADRESSVPAPMAPAMQDALIVDQLKIENGDTGDEEHVYYIFAERYEGDQVIETCQVDDADLTNVRFGNMIYAALNAVIPCYTSDMADFGAIRLKLSVWVQKDNGPEEVGSTEITRIDEMIGEQLDFTNGKGYVRLRSIATAPFSSRYARLEELANLVLTDLTYSVAATASETIEVHFRSPDGYSVVCAGPDQGLTGIDNPDVAYAGLNAEFVEVTGQRELFGWNELDAWVVARSDSKTCPAALSGTVAILGSVNGLTPEAINQGSVSFDEGGQARWSYNAGQ